MPSISTGMTRRPHWKASVISRRTQSSVLSSLRTPSRSTAPAQRGPMIASSTSHRRRPLRISREKSSPSRIDWLA